MIFLPCIGLTCGSRGGTLALHVEQSSRAETLALRLTFTTTSPSSLKDCYESLTLLCLDLACFLVSHTQRPPHFCPEDHHFRYSWRNRHNAHRHHAIGSNRWLLR